MAEDSASRCTFADCRNHKQPCILGVQCVRGVTGYYEVFKICQCLAIKGFICEEEKYVLLYISSRQHMRSSFLDQLKSLYRLIGAAR